MKSVAVALASVALACGGLSAASAADFTVPNGPATGPIGYNMAVGPVSSSDMLTITTSGIAFEQPSSQYGTNAAGIVIVAGENASYPVGSATASGSTGQTYGALYLDFTSTNGTFDSGPVQLYSSDAANGLGSSNAPQTLTFNGTYGSLFGRFADNTSGVINFRVSDDPTPPGYTDNSGSFTGSFDVNAVSAAPEPGTWALMFAGVAMLGAMLRFGRRRQGAALAA